MVPRPDYGARLLLWKHLLLKAGATVTPELDLSALAKISGAVNLPFALSSHHADGYTPGAMAEAITQVLNPRCAISIARHMSFLPGACTTLPPSRCTRWRWWRRWPRWNPSHLAKRQSSPNGSWTGEADRNTDRRAGSRQRRRRRSGSRAATVRHGVRPDSSLEIQHLIFVLFSDVIAGDEDAGGKDKKGDKKKKKK